MSAKLDKATTDYLAAEAQNVPSCQNKKPVPAQYDFDRIPNEFKNHNNWLLWKYIEVNGRWTKVPYQTNGSRADSTNPKTWCSFDNALFAYESIGGFDGLGFAIGDSGLTCIDVDHLSEWDWQSPLEPIANSCYAEMSPSGDGLHIWVKAEKPNNKCKSKSFHNSMIEIYNSDRFITMTGANGDGSITECQDQFDEAFKDLFFPQKVVAKPVCDNVITLHMDDGQIISRICNENSKGRNEFIGWHNFGAADGEDLSAADQGYVNKIAFYSQDAAQIERIWLSSALGQREKTQTRDDYRLRTIEKALSDVATYQSGVSGMDAAKSLESQPETQNGIDEQEEIRKDADLISICGESPIAKFASELADSAKMPRNTTFLTVLSIFSAVTSRYMSVSYQYGGSQPLGINFCGEQPPGAAKSRVLSEAQSPVVSSIRVKQKAIRKQIREKAKEFELAEGDDKKALKTELEELRRELNSMFEFITDTTPEALDMTLQHSNGYYSIASAEQGAINSLLGISYSDTKTVSNRDLALKGYNGEWHNSKRKGRDTYSGNVVGTITALAQNGMIENLLKASDQTGVFERFFVWSEGTLLGTRDHTQYHKIDEFISTEYSEALSDIYAMLVGTEYLDLMSLSISDRAWHKLAVKRNEHEKTIGDDGENSATILRGVIAKYDLFVMKVAANLHLSINAGAALIHDDRVTEAMQITDAYITHLKGLIADSAIEALSDREQAVMDFIGIKHKTGKQINDKLYRRKEFLKGGKANRKAVADTVKKLLERDLVTVKKCSKNPSKFNDAMFWIE